ncbi:MAG: glycosyltransferase family 4 protein [Nitrospinota bacterium]|nr:glycosyltransferase family 4 protein [Nitrospinota bacterium]
MKTAFVIPFYGAAIGGGAESQCRMLAENLKKRGVDVEIITTCIRDFMSDWSHNHHTPGLDEVNGVPVRRFEVRPVNGAVFGKINEKLMARSPLTLEEEVDYADSAVNSDALYHFIGENKKDYLYFFMPYLFGLTLNGVNIAPEKSYMIPCLHDEGYADMRITRRAFQKVNAVLFNSRAEMRLAMRMYDGLRLTEPILMGEGVDQMEEADGQRFRSAHGLGQTPYILYAGRRDQTKNTPLLVEYFRRYRKLKPESPLKLVSMGPASVPIPDEIASHTLDLGYAPLQSKRDAMAGATVLCQPSLMESFSLVIMESWLCGRPVLVHSACEVTRDHVELSGGGFAFGGFGEFFEQVEALVGNPALAARMGRRGGAYVRANYDWDVICGRFIRLLEAARAI